MGESVAFCIDADDLVPAAIAMLVRKHPGALPISSGEWKTEGGKTALVLWWCPSPVADPKPKRGCNRHDDCDKADADWRKRHPGEQYPPTTFHCHDECCEECFGN
jgi:hypothetical protein